MNQDQLRDLYQHVARQVHGGILVRQSIETLGLSPPAAIHVLAFGKVAFPMFDGLINLWGADRLRSGLVIAPSTRFPAAPNLPPQVRAMVADHPTPSARSLAAGQAAKDFVAALSVDDVLLVLVSGGGSALLVGPAPGLSFDDKRATTTAVARGGATISELNAVRKHLSSVKGGRLALATRAQTIVLAMSDVVGNDPGTIASGPFSPDSTSFADAAALVRRLAGPALDTVPIVTALHHLDAGARDEHAETPKPGDPRLDHVTTRIIAGPDRVTAEAQRWLAAAGKNIGCLATDTEDSVQDLAARYGLLARNADPAQPRVFVGNGEPSIVVMGNGRGGRSTHLALLMARELQGMPHVAFLSAGTDDRDGACDATGAVVDGSTWAHAWSRGLDPDAAVAQCDSASILENLGCLVYGPGTSNLLDLHLLSVGCVSTNGAAKSAVAVANPVGF